MVFALQREAAQGAAGDVSRCRAEGGEGVKHVRVRARETVARSGLWDYDTSARRIPEMSGSPTVWLCAVQSVSGRRRTCRRATFAARPRAAARIPPRRHASCARSNEVRTKKM